MACMENLFREGGMFFESWAFFSFFSLKHVEERTETQRKVLQSLKHRGSSSVIRHVFEFLTRRHNPILSRIFRLMLQKQQISINGNCDWSLLLCSRVHRWDTFASQQHWLWRPCMQHLKYLIPLNILWATYLICKGNHCAATQYNVS